MKLFRGKVLAGCVSRKLNDGRGGLRWTPAHSAKNAAYRDIPRADSENHCGKDGGEDDRAKYQIIQGCRTHQLGIHVSLLPF